MDSLKSLRFMKKCLFPPLIFFLFSCIQSQAQHPDTTLNQLLAINASHYINKPLDSIISVLPDGYTQLRVSGWRKTARFITVSYPNKLWIELHVRQFSYMNPVDPNHVWDINLMRLENLHHISISKGGTCYVGCPDY